ncbi:MAG TPA: SpoIIE family protein phosphatase [Terracidiphilus sp.]|jgi:phosphoserine phosphatase RsbU/P
MTIGFRAAKSTALQMLGGLALVLAAPLALAAQSPAIVAPAPGTSASAPAISGTMILDGPWRFQVGDDPRWADAGYDDSTWSTVTLSTAITEQGFDPYTGYGWYRLRLSPQQLAQFKNLPGNPQLDLLVSSYTIGQLGVYLNGEYAGHTQGMTDRPDMYQSPPLVVPLSQPAADGSIVLAIRSWAGPITSIRRGLLAKVELGAATDVAEKLVTVRERHWDQDIIGSMIVSFLFLSVAMLGATLYYAQRNHAEYLWLALLCLSVAATGAIDTSFSLALLPWSVYNILELWTGRIFMTVTLEFVLRFTESKSRRLVRIVQIAFLLLPIVSLVHLQQVYEYLGVASQVLFCALVCWLLLRSWRRGRLEAGVMLVPFFLAATADSMDTVLGYAASKHWISDQFAYHRYHLGPIEFPLRIITYTIFLGSLLAVIFYRFIHVSQDEQRGAAEIEAARSVQAMLIPTQLPSNHNFMLESAYLPANGVGGDFFQVLPLGDGSMLIVVGDVSGKGLQAAMNASTLVGALRNEISHDPAVVLNRLNNVLIGATSGPGAGYGEKSAASFATCVCARVYPDGTMTIANAGHLHPYRDGRELDLAADLPLGVINDIQYEQATFQLNVGDRLIFLSDGVVEAANAQGELFGFERTQQVSNESARYIAQTAKRFGQTDDITVVSMYFAARSTNRAAQPVLESV